MSCSYYQRRWYGWLPNRASAMKSHTQGTMIVPSTSSPKTCKKPYVATCRCRHRSQSSISWHRKLVRLGGTGVDSSSPLQVCRVDHRDVAAKRPRPTVAHATTAQPAIKVGTNRAGLAAMVRSFGDEYGAQTLCEYCAPFHIFPSTILETLSYPLHCFVGFGEDLDDALVVLEVFEG